MKKKKTEDRELLINKIVQHVRQETLDMLLADPNEVINMVLMDVISQLQGMSEKELNRELKGWEKKESDFAFDFYN